MFPLLLFDRLPAPNKSFSWKCPKFVTNLSLTVNRGYRDYFAVVVTAWSKWQDGINASRTDGSAGRNSNPRPRQVRTNDTNNWTGYLVLVTIFCLSLQRMTHCLYPGYIYRYWFLGLFVCWVSPVLREIQNYCLRARTTTTACCLLTSHNDADWWLQQSNTAEEI